MSCCSRSGISNGNRFVRTPNTASVTRLARYSDSLIVNTVALQLPLAANVEVHARKCSKSLYIAWASYYNKLGLALVVNEPRCDLIVRYQAQHFAQRFFGFLLILVLVISGVAELSRFIDYGQSELVECGV